MTLLNLGPDHDYIVGIHLNLLTLPQFLASLALAIYLPHLSCTNSELLGDKIGKFIDRVFFAVSTRDGVKNLRIREEEEWL